MRWYKYRVEDPWTITAAPPVLTLAGEFDLSARDELTEAVLTMVADRTAGEVCLEISGVTFIDSEALAAIILGMNAARESGKPFQVDGARGVVRRVLDIAGLTDLIDSNNYRP